LWAISFGLVLLRLFETAREFQMEVQPQLVLLQKTLLAIEGLGRQLYPELDLWSTAKPILEDWMRERKDPRAQLKRLLESLPQIGDDLLALPDVLSRLVREARRPRKAARGDRAPRERTHLAAELTTGAVLLLAGVLWTGLGAAPLWLGWLSAIVGLGVLWLGWRRG
jgi:ubiquinone biosynthesis protein